VLIALASGPDHGVCRFCHRGLARRAGDRAGRGAGHGHHRLVGGADRHVLPFIFARLDRDPAAASGPLVTSIADVLGVLIYFTIAARLLSL
jgi:hypothetical protein